MLYYFTFNESFSGVYKSQVIDVVKLYSDQNITVRLIAFVSPKNYLKDKKNIKQHLENSIVIPSIPKLKNWKYNKFLFSLVTKKNSIIICRGIFATNIALSLKKNKFKRIIYDGRGAVMAEQEEYAVYEGTGVQSEIKRLERNAILKSVKQIAVTKKLVEYWQSEYSFIAGSEVVIPSTISDYFLLSRNANKINSIKNKLGIEGRDIVIIYSGSIAGWQSLEYLNNVIHSALNLDPLVKVIFLSKNHDIIEKFIQDFPKRVFRFFVLPEEVNSYLDIADYGLLLREQSITNQVASPVKCAEYLARGLKVLISPKIGDYSELINKNNLGMVIKDAEHFPQLIKNDRRPSELFAQKNLSKQSETIINKYCELLQR